MHKTPWTSDRLPSTPKQKPQTQKKQKSGKSTPIAESDVAKSKAVRELETLISRLSSSQTSPIRDPKGGCFCLAREHPLSQYTPSCPSCAFILCSLNPPYNLCPSCSSSLLVPPNPSPSSLIDDIKTKLTLTLETEELERQRVIEETKRAAGAFPQLFASNPNSKTKTNVQQPRPAHETGHKILSLTSSSSAKSSLSSLSGKQKIKIISISHTPTPTSSRPSSGTSTPPLTEMIIRIPPPPSTIDHAQGKFDPNRPWKNYLLDDGDEVRYIPSSERNGVKEGGDPDREGMSRNQRRKANQRLRQEGGGGKD